MAERLLRRNEAQLAAAFGQRLSWALQHAGLSIGQAAKKLRQPRGLVERWAQGELYPRLIEIVDVARLCGFDARWLATGEISEATQEYVAGVRKCFAAKKSITAADRNQVLELIQRLPVPDRGPGECRYCGCTDMHGCGDCCWVDEDAGCTICSSCLETTV